MGRTLLRARAPKGKRAHGKTPRNWGKNVTLISCLWLEGISPSMAVEGATDKRAFDLYVEHFLAPSLKESQVVVMENLSSHKGQRVRELIEVRDAEVLFLPPYSPDFSPIEEAFSKIKAMLRRAKARTKEELVEALGWALDGVSRADVSGWLAHCGYRVGVRSA